ncbi:MULTISPECIES: MFS transporter [Chitinophagaceae]
MQDSHLKTQVSVAGYSKQYSWLVVALLWFVALLNYMDRQMLSTMRPAMEQSIAELKDPVYFGKLMAAFLWIYGCMSPVSGWVADRSNKKWLIVSSLFVWSLITFLMGYAQSFRGLYVLRALMGISEALYIPAALSLIAAIHNKGTRALAIGIHMSGLYMGQALGGFGASIAKHFSWQSTFHGLGVVGIAYALVLILSLKNDKPYAVERHGLHNVDTAKSKHILTMPAFWIILLYFAVSSLPGWGIKNWLPTLISTNLNIGMESAGPIATISIACASFIGVLLGGTLSDKWVHKNIRARIYTSTIGLGLTIPALIFLGFGDTIFFCIMAGILFGIGYGMFDANNMPILCQFVGGRSRAFAYGIMNMTGVFAGALVTDVLGRATANGNLGASFAWMSLAVGIIIVLILSSLRPKRSGEHDA